jgi:nucleotide-binding universal stress UspA family protein
METRRWLVPFTWGVHMPAIDSVVHLAEGGGAILVAVSLLSRPDNPGSRGPRLEHIQQSKDFLEAMQWKAGELGVALERHEVITVDVMQSIAALTRELHCDAIVLVSRGEREALLSGHQLKRLLEEPPAALLVLRLASQERRKPAVNPVARFLSWLRQRKERGEAQDQDAAGAQAELPAPEEPLWIRTEGYHGG